ncbi:Ig-like domain-containing protein, partial [Leeuwenhoekiella sp. NPDC079379]|uniref:Ig-like domain-containing protein n=1 Tax=Leeuwenhoekiella sp. NPDC079379 TaxID=3364122 RepID=UPI0037C90C1F
ADTFNATEDTLLSEDVSTNDTYSAAATYAYNNNADNGGTVVMAADGTFDYTPAPDFAGDETFTYTVTDVNGTTETVSVTITVADVVDIIADTDNTLEDTAVTTAVLDNDTFQGTYGTDYTITATTDPTNGTITLNTDGTITYLPNPDFNGTDSYTYSVTDVNGAVSTETISITITPVVDIVADADTTLEDTTVTTAVLDNDTFQGTYGTDYTITATTDPANGTITLNADGTITYLPNPDFNGADSYTYSVTDVNGAVSTETVSITITPVVDIVADADTTLEDTAVTTAVLDNDTFQGTYGTDYTITATTDPANGTITLNADGTITYLPNPDFNGTDSYTYSVTDVNGAVSTETVSITITPVVDIVADADTTLEDTAVTTAVLDNDTFQGTYGTDYTITATTGPTNGTITLNTDGTITYLPNPDFNGTDSYTYSVTDVNGAVSTERVSITITPVVDIVADADTTLEDTAVTTAVLDNDTFQGTYGTDYTITATTDPTNGTITLNTDGTITYLPNPDFNGADSYTYSVTDVNGAVSTETVSITVTPVVDSENDITSTLNEQTIEIDVLINDTEVPILGTLTVSVSPANGTVSILDNGTPNDPSDDTILYTPNDNFFGIDTFEYTVCDQNGGCDSATVTVTVDEAIITAIDDDLTGTPVPGNTGAIAIVNVLDNDLKNNEPVDPTEVSITPITVGPLTVNADGSVDIAPETPQGNYSIEYTVCEIANPTNCETAVVTVIVAPAVVVANADDFSANPITGQTGGVAGDVTTNDTLNGDPVDDGDITISVADNGGLTGVTMDADGSVIVPAATPAGTYDITYSICENLNPTNCETAVVTVVVAPAVLVANADDFSASPITGQTGGVAGDVTTNDTLNGDPVDDGDITISVADNGGLSGVTIDADGSVIVPAATPAGTYDITYSICENLNPTNCETAVVTVVVAPAVLVANADDFSASPITGQTGGVAGDVTTNDTLNGDPVDDGDITISVADNGGLTGVTIDADGSVIVPAATPAGTYDITYSICENLNPTNCETAVVTVVVAPAVLVANADDFSANPITGQTGGVAGDVTANDTLNGDPVDDGDITISVANNGGLPGVTIDADGSVIVPAATPAGTYDITYSICENLNPTNCETAVVTVVVAPAVLVANADDFSANPITGQTGGVAGDVTTNDTLNGDPVDDGDITISVADNGGLTGVTIDADGSVIVPAATPAGTYDITYSICENLNPTNCETAIVTVVVAPAVLVANTDDFSANPITGQTGGVAGDVTTNDTLNGDPVDDGDITISVADNGGLTGVTIDADGSVIVPAATPAGTYDITYSICENLNPTNCETAIVTVVVAPAVLVANTDDFSANPITGQTGGVAGDVTTNDTLNGDPVDDGDITISVADNGGLTGVTIDADGSVIVPAATPAGTYDITYSICENLNPTNCETAVVTVVVAPAVLVANADDFSANPITGQTGGVAGDVTANDTLNGDPVDDGNITISVADNGGLNGVTIDADGSVIVPAATPAGTYDITYSICENLNPTNCETAVVTVVVAPAVLVANTDDFSANPITGQTGGVAGDVTTNDTLNGDPVDDGDITISVADNGGLTGVTIDADGSVIVPAATPAGTYDITYSICENLNPTNCETAIVTVVVAPAVLVANADDFSANPITGQTGGVAGDVTTNDTLNGDPVDDGDITISVADNGGLSGVTIDADGSVIVPAATPAGTYDITYSICENLNPTNCETAVATVVVAPAVLVANTDDFSANPITGQTGGVAGDVTTNDTLNGDPVDDGDITISVADNGGLSGVTIDADGSVIVPAATPAGTYDITYSICENLNPTNCETAVVTVVVAPAVLVANTDDFSANPITGQTGGVAGDVTTNDTLNGDPVDDGDITISVADNGGLSGVTIDADGSVIVPAATPAGTYDITYSICENLNPTNCETAIVTVVVAPAVLVANTDDFSANPITGQTGGVAGDVTTNDTLNGDPVDDGDITISVADNGGLTGVTIDADGSVIVPAATPAGTYDITYSICENLNPTNCETAVVTVVVAPAVLVANADDFSANPITGQTGGVAGDVTTNDTLNGDPVDDGDITISVADNGGLSGVTIDADGSVIVPAATPAGTYDITYSICENLNPTNCETAVVTVVVAPAVIGAEPDDFSATPVNGLTGGIAGDVTANDTFNGAPVDDDDVFISDDGGIQGASIDNNGSLIIPPGTPAGTYTIIYTICENLNPGNCGSAPITILISAASIDAIADDFSATPVNGYIGGATASVYGNDTLNETGFNNNKVRPSVIDNDGITGLGIQSNGTLTIPSKTPAGTYTITYQICEALNPSNCDTAQVTIVISEPVIIAVNDDFSARTINGIEGGSAGNVLNNDNIGSEQANASTVAISILNDGGVNGLTISPNGVIVVPANTPANTYTIEYQLCDVLNPSNCTTASAIIKVGAGTLNANDDDLTASQVNGYQGGTLSGILDNDLLNNTAVDPASVTLSLVDNGGITGLSIDENGAITIPANTKAGSYSVIYQICEDLNTDNCDSATVLISVVAPAIVAVDDDFTGDSVNGFTGGTTPSVLNNDSLDGNALAASEVKLQLINTGGLDGLELNTDGSFAIPSGTPAGDYTVSYEICENLNPNNCTTASVTIRVDATPIEAIADDFTANTIDGQSGGIAGDITDNDTLNGVAVDDNDIDITLISSGGLNGVEIDNDGTVSVPPLTPTGVYTVTYSICENLNPNNCSGPVSVQINVGQSTLVLTPDNFNGTPVSGPNGGIAGNVLTNDTFNGATIDAADVDVTLTNNGGLSGVRINDNGNLIVPPNTPAGTYTITYSVCENLNPNNCSSTTATIAVEAADLVATNDDFSATPVNGADGGVAGNVLGNDTLDNAAVSPTDVTISLADNGGLSGVAINNNGNLIVPPNTPAGSYTITYSICENLNPNNCQTATATIVVEASELIAGADDFSNTLVNGKTGGVVGDVTDNDTLNGDPVEDADVFIVNNGGLNGASINNNGNLVVPPNTPAGTYTVSYSICEVLNPNNCATTTVTVVVAASDLVATNDDFSAKPVNGADGGVAGNVLGNDTLDNAAVSPTDVTISLADNGGLSGVAINNNGNLIVPPNTPAGSYTITYSICENLNPNNCQTATATIVVEASELIAGTDDF